MANNQTIGVNLKFSADVSAAKRAMAELQGSLSQIHNVAATSANPGIRYAKDLNQASQAAAQLRIQLQNAFNQDTGKLNLTKFNMEMKQAGMSVEKYRAALTSIGPQGQQAFTQLAHAITIADTHTISLSNGLQRLGTTFMNTLRYQLSASVLMAFTSGISEAVSYVKDLNTSLNDIRIVTSYGAEEMKEFASQANKAAKILSTTTNEYAKASLIYFQQGLSDEEVQRRTDLTIKMANVTKQSVSEVSDQLTAVWNNFDNGTKSLDHYVDVMVALGAATASSSEEISEGLNKFAAVAETVGLSYEYAASALATVTATTRQSADVVGTAFKTLFARIQDLELGKKLDDGTTLGQYSQALKTVGINIKDSNGNLKDMNDILDEIGAKWNTLSKDSQVALAQNVAGVRQYTQLIALMDNWDFFKQNLNTANASAGALQEQADIYAESWEAASERVTASLETIYNKLLNDEFFIGATNLLADFIGLVENLIDGLGGMPGLLALIGTALTRVFSTQMANGINNMAYNIRSMTKTGKAENAKLQQEFSEGAAAEYGTAGMKGQQGVLAKEEASSQFAFIKNKGKMNEMQRQSLELRLKELNAQKQTLNAEIEETKSLERQAQVQKKITKEITGQSLADRRNGFADSTLDAAQQTGNKYLQNATRVQSRAVAGNRRGFFDLGAVGREEAINDLQRSSAALSINDQSLNIGAEDTFTPLTEAGAITNGESQIQAVNELQSRLKELGVTAEGVEAQMQDVVGAELSKKYQSLAEAADIAEDEIKRLQQELKEQKITEQEFKAGVEAANQALNQQAIELQEAATEMSRESNEALRLSGATEESRQAFIDNGTAAGTNQHKIAQLRQQHRGLQKDIDQSIIKTLDFGQSMTAAANLISTTAMVVTSLIGLYKTLTDENISAGEKVTTVLTTIGFMLPMIITLFNEQNKALFLTIGRNLALAGSQAGLTASMEVTSFSALKLTAVMKGLGKTIGKFAIYAAAIAIVVAAVSALAKAADDARNSAKNFAASATQGAKDAAEAYSEATTAFNKLKDSIESYENALTGLQKLTEGTNEYKQALFDANEQALALVQSHAGLKYYIDSNGLIVFEEGELDRIESEAQQKKADAYSAKLGADKAAREANIDYQKIQLGRKLEGQDYEWNDEDTASAGTGAAIGAGAAGIAGGLAGGALIGAKLGQLGWAAGPVGALIGTVAGVVIGGVVGAIAGAGVSGFDNDATKQEQEAMDALYEAYKEQGNAALTEAGIRKALSNVGINDENLILSLAKNKDATEELMKAMEANTAAIEAETRSAAVQQAHALDDLLQYKDSESQAAITEAMTRMRTEGAEKYDFDPNSYRSAGLFNWWYSENQTGKDVFNAWATAQGLTKKNVKATNYSDNYIEYEYIDDEGKTQQKKVQYSQLAAWQESQAIDEYAKSAYNSIKKAVEAARSLENNEGLMSIVGGQSLMTLSEKEVEAFKKSFDTGKYQEYIKNNWKVLGYESEQAFTKAISEGIANYNPEEAFAKFSKTLKAEINGILSAGAEKTKYTTGALENYTEALAENNEALHDNADEWKNLEKKKFAAQAAVANTKFVKGVDALTKVLEKNLETLIKWDEASLDTYEAADKVQTALEDVFGVRVSADFIKNNLSDIQRLAQGSTENIKELSRAAAIDFALNIDTMSEETKGNFVAMINQLADIAADGIEIGTNIEDINDSDYIAQLNKMLEAGEITAEQIQQSFGALGYSPDIKFKTVKQKNTTIHYVYDNPEEPESFKTIKSVTETDVQVPYVAGENTLEPAAEDGSDSGQEKGKGITKIRDVGSIGASLSDTKKKNKDDKIKELDRYHEIKEELADIERGLKKIAKAKDGAFGKAKLDLIDQEIKQQEKLNDAEKRYYDQIKLNYDKDLANLDSRFKLDENGRIKNYTKVLQDLINNGITGDAYEEIKKSADQYEKTLNELEAQQEVVNNGILTLKDKALEKIEYEVEIKVHFDDREIKRLEHLLKNLEDFSYDNAVKSIDLLGQMAQRNINSTKTYLEGINKVLGEALSEEQQKGLNELITNPPSIDELPNALSNILGDTQITARQKEDIEKYIDSLYTEYDDLSSFYEDIAAQVSGAFDDMNEKSEKTINRVEQLGKTLETYWNIIDLVGKKSLGITDEQIRALGRAQVAQAKTNLQTLQGQLDLNKSALENAKAQRDIAEAAGDTEAVKYWEEQIETIQNKVWELEGNVESTLASTLQTIADDFTSAVETATSAFEEAMTGIYGSYDKLQEIFEQQKEIGDRYVEDYQKIYDLSKLNRDLAKSIDETDSIKGKQALRDLQKEINELQESDTEMSQHDLDYLRKKYDLKVAEIALEEAQNAKSQVRMSRDAEGNWGYVYTADEVKIDKAQQDYEDKLYEIQKSEQEYLEQMQDMVIQSEIKMIEAINALRAEDFVTQEEYQAEVTRITEYYTGMRNYALNELNKSLDNSKIIYETDWMSYSEKTGYKISKEIKWCDTFQETEYAMTTGYGNIEVARSAFEAATSKMVDNLTKAFTDWELDVKETFRLVNQDFDNFGGENGTLNEKVKDITGKLDEVNQKFSGWKTAAENGFGAITTAAANKFTAFAKEIEKYKDEINNVINTLTYMLELAGVEIPAPKTPTETEGVEGNTQGGNTVEDTVVDKVVDDPPKEYYGTYYDINGNQRRTTVSYGTQEDAVKAAKKEAQDYAQQIIDVDKEKEATGGSGKYAYSDVADVLADISQLHGGTIYGSTEYNNIMNGAVDSAKGWDIYQGVSKKGEQFTITPGYFSIGTYGEDFTLDIHKPGNRTALKQFVITKNEVEKIRSKLGKEAQLSMSGDSLTQDPVYEVGDTVSVEQALPFNENGGQEILVNKITTTGKITKRSMWKGGKNYYQINNMQSNPWGVWKDIYVVEGAIAKQFDTGGYTGSWDSSGRLAMLHQKEIVLNAHDTENFLAAVNIVRDIASIIDLQAAAQRSTLSMISSASVNPTAQTLQQEVTIHAEFPNATQRTEIEAAFDTLLNRASQFANRKN